MGDVKSDEPVLVRVHTENVTCDMFGSLIDDTGFQLHTALEKIRRRSTWSRSVFTPARAQFGSVNQLRTYNLMQQRGLSKREAS